LLNNQPDILDTLYELERSIIDLAQDFNEQAKHIQINVLTSNGIVDSLTTETWKDVLYIQIAFSLVAVYTITMIGNFSPIHLRMTVAIVGLCCVGLAYLASLGLAGLMGFELAGIHNLLPFLLLGIGVDDIFVITTSVDQTSVNLMLLSFSPSTLWKRGSGMELQRLAQLSQSHP